MSGDLTRLALMVKMIDAAATSRHSDNPDPWGAAADAVLSLLADNAQRIAAGLGDPAAQGALNEYGSFLRSLRGER